MLAHEAFVTLATTDSYSKGAVVVAKSLRRHGTTRSIVVMVTPNISSSARSALEEVFDQVVVVDLLDSEDYLRLSLLGRPELGVTFTKIHCWTLVQFNKCVFLDADTLVLGNVDDLFSREELAAAPDPGWPDCFNSGVFVFRPSLQTHALLVQHAAQHGSFDGGDQGLLNSFFSSWPHTDLSKHLPFIYNLSASTVYSYLPAFKRFGHQAKIVHFLGSTKPWNSSAGSSSRTMGRYVDMWWTEYRDQNQSQNRNQKSSSSSLSSSSSSPSANNQRDLPFVSYTKTTVKQKKGTGVRQSRGVKNIQFKETREILRISAPLPPPPPSPQDPTVTQVLSQLPPSPQPEAPPTAEKKEEEEEEESMRCELSEVEEASAEEEEQEEEEDEDVDLENLEEEIISSSEGEVDGTYPSDADSEDDEEHRRQWEIGQADYLGRDAFENIQKMLDRFLG
ncbi:unnamed protein product [Knipowitschia caucasica]